MKMDKPSMTTKQLWMMRMALPIYYTSGNVVTKDESWTTDSSMDSNGTQETSGARHLIARLPFDPIY